MGERVRQFGIGLAVDENDTSQCVEAMRRIAAAIDRHGHLPGAQYEAYHRLHSFDQLRTALMALASHAKMIR